MQTLVFNIQINAPAAKVWHSLWESENYKRWTNVFCAGSYYKMDSFTEGSKVHFLSPNGGGMYSVVDKIIDNQLLVFRHIGELSNFEEQPINEQTKHWENAMEGYELIPTEAGTTLEVKVDTDEKYMDNMKRAFPLALQELKKIAEG